MVAHYVLDELCQQLNVTDGGDQDRNKSETTHE